MRTPGAELLVDAGAELAEGPVWEGRTGELVWVDILAGAVHRTDVRSGADRIISIGEHVGAVALTDSGALVAATPTAFRLVERPIPPHPILAALPRKDPTIRMNDGKVDPAGRFVAGTTAYDARPGAGALYSLTDGHVTTLLTGVTISNGLAWAANGRTMYYVDTPTQRIDVMDYDPEFGTIGSRRPWVRIPPRAGAPDGICIDEAGGIWVALWGGGAVHRYAERRHTHTVTVPRHRPSSVALGGDDGRTLFITTATDDDLRHPNGSVFVAEVDVPGPATRRFGLG